MSAPDSSVHGATVPSVSVVVPTLDEARTVVPCLSSAAVGPVELVVSDGGSTDGTLDAVARDFPSATVVRGSRGRGAQLNRGAAATTAPVLVFLHADCRLPEGWLDAVSATLARPQVVLGCFRLHTGPPEGAVRGACTRLWWRLLDLRSLGLGLPYGDQAFFLARETFEALGGFADIPLMEDLDLARRCRRRGRIATVPLEVRTTGRRFARHPVRARLCTLTFPLLFRWGVDPALLARWYGDAR